jgi:mono/diheme cytochrome c family protein
MRVSRERIRTGSQVLLGLVLSSVVLAGATAMPQKQPETSKPLESLIYSVKGPDLFRAHCAACHGSDGKGGGPVAPALKVKVPDLTVLAKNNRGRFPSIRVAKFIAGDEPSQSHGPRDMPIWGPIFHQIESDQDFGKVRMENLTKYLESIQRK